MIVIDDATRGRFRENVADLVGIRRTRTGAYVVFGKRFRSRLLAVKWVNAQLMHYLTGQS